MKKKSVLQHTNELQQTSAAAVKQNKQKQPKKKREELKKKETKQKQKWKYCNKLWLAFEEEESELYVQAKCNKFLSVSIFVRQTRNLTRSFPPKKEPNPLPTGCSSMTIARSLRVLRHLLCRRGLQHSIMNENPKK